MKVFDGSGHCPLEMHRDDVGEVRSVSIEEDGEDDKRRQL